MIPPINCKFIGCNFKQLETIEEADMGLCGRHSKQIQCSNHVTIICWTCGSLLETMKKDEVITGSYIEDKYIFSKHCPQCSNTNIGNLQYLTFSNEVKKDLSLKLSLDDDGLIVANNDKEPIAGVSGGKVSDKQPIL